MSPDAAAAVTALAANAQPIPRQSNLMDPTRCVMPVKGVSPTHMQCGRTHGHGLLNLFCRQHAQILRRRWEESKCRIKSTSQASPAPISSSPITASKLA